MRRHCEPNLEQLLADPLIRLVMASDSVAEGDVRRLADQPRFSRGLASDRALSPVRDAGGPRSFRLLCEADDPFGFAPDGRPKDDHQANLGWAC